MSRTVFASREEFTRLSGISTENNGKKTCSGCSYLDKALQMQNKSRIGAVNICTKLALRESGRKKAIPFMPQDEFSCKFWRTKDE